MSGTAIAYIDLDALKHNLSLIKLLMPNKKILPMVKANAYGHGLCAIAKAFDSTQTLGVANLSEALKLRSSGLVNPLVVMRGFCDYEELQAFFKDPNLIACIHDQSQLSLLNNQASNLQIKSWLKIDTGMHRLGFSYQDSNDIYHKLSKLNVDMKDLKIFSHLSDADNVDESFTKSQLQRFIKYIEHLPVEKSILNSAGILAYSDFAYDWIRPGILMYGASPFSYNASNYNLSNEFKPVMTLTSKLIAIKRVLPGEFVGYGCAFKADREMLVGVVGIGYGDGYPRLVKAGTPVIINNLRCPIIGRVSMDMLTVDISKAKVAAVGDQVILWGKNLSVDEIAYYTNSIPHELLAQITGRVQYLYI